MKTRGVDSRYSWAVAVACGVVFSLINCPMRLGAQLFVSIKDYYGTSRDAASLPFEVAYFTRSIAGPLAGYVGQKIGLQKVTMIGCITSATGMFACFFANNIVTVDVFLGFVFGVGYGWATALVPEIINQHFVQYRTIGNGIVFGASGLSGFVTPPLLVLIQNTYGESASFLIISGIVLNTIPAAMLLTKPRDEDKPMSGKSNSFTNHETNPRDQDKPISKASRDSLKNHEIKSRGQVEATVEKSKNRFSNHEMNNIKLVHKSSEGIFQEKNFLDGDNPCAIQTPDFEKKFSTDLNNHIIFNPSFKQIGNPSNNLKSSCQTKEIDCENLKLSNVENRQMSAHKMIELNVNDLNNQLSSESCNGSYMKPNNPNDFIPKVEVKASMFESINILWTPKFLLITFIQSSHFYIMYMFWTITIDVVRDKGVEKDLEVYFVMALSLFDTIGRFFLACVTDCTSVTSAHFSSVCFVIIGLSCLLLVFVSGFEATLAAICLLGLIIGGNTTSLPGIITGFIEKEKRPLAMASRLILYAPMSFTMSPLIGYFREVLYSYDGLLYIMMSMCFTCSIVLQVLSRMHKCTQ